MIRVALVAAVAAGTVLVSGGPAASHVGPADYHDSPGYEPPASPSPSPAVSAGRKTLVATVGPGSTISLRTAAGKRVKRLAAGRYTVRVRDRSDFHNFHLRGPGVDRKTGVSYTGTTRWTVRFRKGKTYRYRCDPHLDSMKGSFRTT